MVRIHPAVPKNGKRKKLKPELASGFIDRKGNELILKDRLIEIIKRNFQLYGFEPLETPGFEISENIGKFCLMRIDLCLVCSDSKMIKIGYL